MLYLKLSLHSRYLVENQSQSNFPQAFASTTGISAFDRAKTVEVAISKMACVLTGAMEEDSQVKGRLSGKTVSNQNASGIHESLELGSKP